MPWKKKKSLARACYQIQISSFDVLLTIHLSIIVAINQLNAQNLVL